MDWLWHHLPRLRRMLRRRGRSVEEAEDAIQELFVRVMLYCRSGREVRDPERFLNRAVLNLSDKIRKREHRGLYVAEPVEEVVVADRRFAPEDRAMAAQCLERLQRTLDAMESRT